MKPAGPGWNGIREEAGVTSSPDSLTLGLVGMLLGCAFVYAALFGAGSFIYGRHIAGSVWTVVFIASGIGLARVLPKMWAKAPAEAEATTGAPR